MIERTTAEKIWDDLTDRSGFCDDVDVETRNQIIDAWTEIIKGGERTPRESGVGGRETLRSRIEACLVAESCEGGSATPNTLLAAFLVNCLDAFDGAVNAREAFYGRGPEGS